MIRRNERSVAVDDAEAICVAIGRQSRQSFLFFDRFHQWRQILLGRIGSRAFK